MRADIHDGPEHQTLHTEAGYIDARPKTGSKKLLATHGRTIHWGQSRRRGPEIRALHFLSGNQQAKVRALAEYVLHPKLSIQINQLAADDARRSSHVVDLRP